MTSKEDHPSKMRRLVRIAPTITPEPALSTVSRIRRLIRKSPETMAAEAAEREKAAAEKAAAEKAAKAEEAEKSRIKTEYPLVSKEQFLHNLKILTAAYKGSKIAAKDQALANSLSDAFFQDDRRPDATPAFLKALAYIYKKYHSAEKYPIELYWMDWMITGYDSSRMLMSSAVQYGAIEHYFNIYGKLDGKRTDWAFLMRTGTASGYLMGFS